MSLSHEDDISPDVDNDMMTMMMMVMIIVMTTTIVKMTWMMINPSKNLGAK